MQPAFLDHNPLVEKKIIILSKAKLWCREGPSSVHLVLSWPRYIKLRECDNMSRPQYALLREQHIFSGPQV